MEDTVLLFAFVTLQSANPQMRRVKLADIPDGRWRDEETGAEYDASVLTGAGVRLPFIQPGGQPVGDFKSLVMELRRIG